MFSGLSAQQVLVKTATSKITHFRNQQILDALEYLEDEEISAEELYQHGKVDVYGSGDAEFFWKGKLTIVFPKPELKLGTLEMKAFHPYKDEEVTKAN